MRWVARFGLVIIAASAAGSALAQNPDDDLKIYAVHVVKTTPFEEPFTGNGIYLGKGAVLTASHVIGRWGVLKKVRVLVADQDLPARIVKEGSLDTVDLTVVAVDPATLPMKLQLRQNPICKNLPRPGQSVIAVAPGRTKRTQIISPTLIAPALRQRFNTLTSEVAEPSGSGIFDAERRCLLGIMSRKVQKFGYRMEDGRLIAEATGFAGYFVPASQIATFLPEDYRF